MTATLTATNSRTGPEKRSDAVGSVSLEIRHHVAVSLMDADGSNQTNVTKNAASDSSPAWSPDGTRIAFRTSRDGNPEVYVMNADGSNPTNLANNAASDASPAWSPDGTRIAFSTSRDGNNEVYVMDADGSNQTNLTSNAASDGSPAWQSLVPPVGGIVELVAGPPDSPDSEPRGGGHEREVAALAVALAAVAGVSWHRLRRPAPDER